MWEYAGDTQPRSDDYKTITGGVITGKRTGGGNGGVLVKDDATFNMEGGNIVGYLAMEAGTAYVFAGGVYNEGTFTMNGGSIKGCAGKAAGAYNEGTFTMNGGTIEYCAGLGGSRNGDYGGVYNEGTFNMNGGSIQNCTSTGFVAGVYNSGTFNMKGGNIQDCTAFEKVDSNNFDSGCGVSNNGTMNVGGDPTKTVTITNNKNNGKEENVYLYTGKTINVVGEMSSDSKIGISLYSTPYEGFKFGNTVVKDVDKLTNVSNPLTIFSDDKNDTVLEVVGNDIQLSHEHEWGPYVVDKGNNKEVSTCTVDGTSHTREHAFTMPTGDTYTISGKVKHNTSTDFIEGAKVSVLQGDRQWDSDETDENGFSLS